MRQPPDNWRELNRANWDERVGLHLDAESYALDRLKAGDGRLDPIVDAGLGDVSGLKILHLQCHFGRDSLSLALRGADVTGLDFSPPAIETARRITRDLGLEDRARFVEADLYDAPKVIEGAGTFDRVFVTWGAICWLPDIRQWARIISHFLKPGGALFFAEGHPAALVFDDVAGGEGPVPGPFAPYLGAGALEHDFEDDYANPDAKLTNTRTVEWMHPMGDVVTALIDAGLTLRWLKEHDRVVWQMFRGLVEDADGLYGWPDRKWLPLSYSLWAEKDL